MSDLEFYNKQDKEELVSMCITRDNKINSLKQENKQLKEENKQLKEEKKQVIEYIKQYDLEGVELDSEYFYECLIELSQILGAD